MQQDSHYDIIIIGAGLVGTSLIVSLAQLGLKIAVLERHLPAIANPTNGDTRPISLNLGSVQILQRFGIWPQLSDKACPIMAVHVSEEGRLGSVKFTAREQRQPALGYVVPFAHLQQALYQRAAQIPGVTFIPINQLESIDLQSDQATVTATTIDGVNNFSAKLLVACDGSRSQTRKLLNISTTVRDHDEVAITAVINAGDHNNCAYERFAREGTLAILPLPDQQCRLVWTMDKKNSDQVAAMDQADLTATLQRVFRQHLGEINSVELTNQYPLKTILAQEQVRSSFVLLGNSAHTL